MPMLHFIQPDGSISDVPAQLGFSMMEAAIWADVPGIEATCGGAISCGTCLVEVDAAWRHAVPDPSAAELELLAVHESAVPGSRLSCQMKVVEAIDGIMLRVPAQQREA